MTLIQHFQDKIPILGVCVGAPMHCGSLWGTCGPRKATDAWERQCCASQWKGPVSRIAQSFLAGRYHSLAVPIDGIPDGFVVDAQTDDGEVMGMHHTSSPIMGVQFHPESIFDPRW